MGRFSHASSLGSSVYSRIASSTRSRAIMCSRVQSSMERSPDSPLAEVADCACALCACGTVRVWGSSRVRRENCQPLTQCFFLPSLDPARTVRASRTLPVQVTVHTVGTGEIDWPCRDSENDDSDVTDDFTRYVHLDLNHTFCRSRIARLLGIAPTIGFAPIIAGFAPISCDIGSMGRQSYTPIAVLR